MQAEPIKILLVEDNPGDVELVKRSLRNGKLTNVLYQVKDGVEAMKFLRNSNSEEKNPCPDLVLLDINLPNKNGLEVLEEIKEDPVLKTIPVIMLTTSSADSDILLSYKHHVNAFVTKPVDAQEFVETVKTIEEFWLTLVKLPSKIKDV